MTSTVEFADLYWFALQMLGAWCIGFGVGAAARMMIDVTNSAGRG